MTIDVTIEAALAACGLPRSEALSLLAHASGQPRERLLADAQDPLPAPVGAAFDVLVRRRTAGEPIAYLVGHREFYGRRFAVDRTVLIPRPETELLVDQALQWIDERAAMHGAPPLRVLDLGTGSGVIAVTLACERPAIEMVATDRSTEALASAEANAASLGAPVRFLVGDWYQALATAPVAARYDLIVANPPYVAAGDPHLGEGDLRFEPRVALTDDDTGLTAIAQIVAGAAAHLRAGGALMVEHGYDQAARTRTLLKTAGFIRIDSVRDLAGIERVSIGRVSAPIRADGLAPPAL